MGERFLSEYGSVTIINPLLTDARNTRAIMTKSYILNERERAALLALSQQDQVPALSSANRDFGRMHLEALVELGLAHRISPGTEHASDDFQIADEGWHCMYGMSKAQIRRQTERKPVPFRIWQWPLPAAIRKAA